MNVLIVARQKSAPLQLPKRVKRRHAEDVADELIGKILLRCERYALFITPAGTVMMCAAASAKFAYWCEMSPASLVGIYDINVERRDVIDDVDGMSYNISHAP